MGRGRDQLEERMPEYTAGTTIDDADGRPLVEVFSVRFLEGGEEDPSPSGTVSVFDGRRGQIIYNGGTTEPPPSDAQTGVLNHYPSQQKGLVLTGPYRAISADGCVTIVLDLLRHGRHDEASRIYVDTYEPYTQYDKAITDEVETGNGGLAKVTYAVLSSAVEAIVEVKLLPRRDCDDLAPAYVQGTILARTKLRGNELDQVIVVLFDGKKVCDRDDGSPEVIIPLARSVLSVPTHSTLTIDVDLRDHSNNQIVNTSIEFYSQLDEERVEHVDGTYCYVEVKITWSDDD